MVLAQTQIDFLSLVQQLLASGLDYDQITKKFRKILESTQDKDKISERIRIHLMVGIQYLLGEE